MLCHASNGKSRWRGEQLLQPTVVAAWLALVLLLPAASAIALEPAQILVIANNNCPASLRLAEYYCARRAVPPENILPLPLGPLSDTISRGDYEKALAAPIRRKLSEPAFAGKIRCLLTTYGVPFSVQAAPTPPGQQENLRKLQKLLQDKINLLQQIIRRSQTIAREGNAAPQAAVPQRPHTELLQQADAEMDSALSRVLAVRDSLVRMRLFAEWLDCYEQLYGKLKTGSIRQKYSELAPILSPARQAEQAAVIRSCAQLIDRARQENWDTGRQINDGFYEALHQAAGLKRVLVRLDFEADRLSGRETGASVDSELSMVMFGDYELHRWQVNELRAGILRHPAITLMVARLDGPGEEVARGLVDKALTAEQKDLQGLVYIDRRGLPADQQLYSPGYFDQSLAQTAELFRRDRRLAVIEEQTEALFAPGCCPSTVVYCGWYSLGKYIDAFDFVEGAVGYHIASWEAVNLRDPNSSQWCPAMLKDGITATMGAVAEPYLHAFPEPKEFFGRLLNGDCLVEAYYRTNPFNSWQLLLVGDPLYTPFAKAARRAD
jgi:uncharacterized protein (TIGR03790 family)